MSVGGKTHKLLGIKGNGGGYAQTNMTYSLMVDKKEC